MNYVPCGRVRESIRTGWNLLLEDQLTMLQVGVLSLEEGQTHVFSTGNREYAFVLMQGLCEFDVSREVSGTLGPRATPFKSMPYAIFVSKEGRVTIKAFQNTLIGVGSAPAAKKTRTTIVTPDMVRSTIRGVENWQREVRFVCWNDNTQGNLLIVGETVTLSGNWSGIPPHRHQYDNPEEEVPYEEAYFFWFSKPQGYGLVWQFDDAGNMDQAFSLKSNDVVYMSEGYHPVVCGPGADLYHLTFMAGPYRMSKARVHDDYRYLLEDKGLHNPYASSLSCSDMKR